MKIAELFENTKKYLEKKIMVSGWIRFNRASKNIGFIEVFDGTYLNGIQLVYKNGSEFFDELSKLPLYSAISIDGILKENNNSLEIVVEKVNYIHKVENELIIAKNKISLERLRTESHIRVKTKYFQSIFSIRSHASHAIHKYFMENQYNYVHSPIITGNDAEGAGEAFLITDQDGGTFFSNQGSLTVSGQLHAEGFAQAFTKVYTFGPTFRAENSNTTKHAAEFWMIEPEIAFADYNDVMLIGEELIKYVIKYVLEKSKNELEFLGKFNDVDQINFLESLINNEFNKISYKEAIDELNKAIKNGVNFENNNIEFGTDLDTDHERYLSEVISNGIPVYVYDYPSKIKSFYMYQNDDETCRGFDLLVPRIGELIGGSQREESYDKLMKTIEMKNLDISNLEWYTNLRKEGYAPSTGFGLGFERLIMLLTGAENIRDTIPFPRTPGKLLF